MTLREALEQAPDDRTLYVGSNSAFVAGGLKKELPQLLEEFDKEQSERVRRKREERNALYLNAVSEYGEDSEQAKRMKADLEKVLEYVPFMDRTVKDQWERFSEDAINIQVEGPENGKIWSLHEADRFQIEFNEEKLAGAVIKTVITDLKYAYRAELAEFKKLLERLEKYRKDSKEFEDWLNSDDLKTYTAVDPAYFIKTTREIVAEYLAQAEEQGREKNGRAKMP